MNKLRHDLTGQKFGMLTVVREDGPKWLCVCECGNTKSVRADSLKSGVTKTCGCRKGTLREFVDLTGQRFDKLVVTAMVDHVFCKALCDCGNETTARVNNVKKGHTRSCGCLGKQNALKHGVAFRNKRLYQIWSGMMARCYKESNPHYKSYGGRGIYVCDRWHDIRNFEADVSNTYDPKMTIDRVDNDGPYSPNNFKLATKSEQQNNRRVNRRIETPRGIMTIAQAAKEFDIKDHTLRNRLSKGWAVDRALMTPIGGVN